MRSLLQKIVAWRNAILGTTLVLMGMVAATITVLARRTEDAELASAAAIASLIIAALLTIFVVPPLARSARSEFGRVDLPFEITKGGLVFLSVLGVVAFAAWNTGNNLLFLVFSLLLSTVFVAWAAARTSLRDMVVKARFPDHIFAGEPAPVIVTLRNAKRFFPSFSVLVEARGPDDIKTNPKRRRRRKRIRFSKRALAYFMYVPHRAAAEQRVEQLFERRGHVLITGFEISTRFPFGFFRRRRRLRARNVDLIVYPKPEPISDELHLLPLNAGQHLSLRRGAGFDLFSLRDYQPQDDLRHIDWKATARSRRLTVREFTAEDERRITIALDTRISRGGSEKELTARFEKSVNYAASLIAHFITERVEVRLALGEEMGRYGTGQEHLYRCLRRLALVMPSVDEAEEVVTPKPETPHAEETQPELQVADGNFAVLLTTAAPGSIPANVWRTSYVKYF
ncbi:MAG TPA: DUF58 domain-containing protein [Pyrinomonadaceae bacterium]|nr:DUF58 domain-containing protein [Pyrinomonadaceae bacterium]